MRCGRRHERRRHACIRPPAAGEGFDRLAREMKVSRGTILRAYDFANRDEAAARLAGRLADRLGRARAGPRRPGNLSGVAR
jgi:hypothetical protein